MKISMFTSLNIYLIWIFLEVYKVLQNVMIEHFLTGSYTASPDFSYKFIDLILDKITLILVYVNDLENQHL